MLSVTTLYIVHTFVIFVRVFFLLILLYMCLCYYPEKISVLGDLPLRLGHCLQHVFGYIQGCCKQG